MTAPTTDRPTAVAAWLDEHEPRFTHLADQIWDHPEVALAEFTAARLQADDLARDGFTVTTGTGGLPTAFVAEFTHAPAGTDPASVPSIGFLGEYDALPGLAQDRAPDQANGTVGGEGPGHGCGHNLLGTAALAAASVTKAWLVATDTPGRVRYYGCPAEETCEGKVFMARAGAFDDLDLAITWHPASHNSVWAGSSLAVNNIRFHFSGRTAHAAANPETGRSALDAVELMSVGVNYLREHVIDAARIHYVITNGGGAPNVVPDEAEVWYFVRAPERGQVEELTERVRKVAAGAALMTETRLEEIFVSGAYNMLTNKVISDRLMSALEALGPIAFDDEEVAFARQVSGAFPESLRRGVLTAEMLPESLLDAGLSGEVWPIRDEGKVLPGSTDVSDVSWITPTSQVITTCQPLAIPGHSWAVTAAAGMSIGHKGMAHAAKAMALTATDFYLDPELRAAARAEFAASTAGRPYVCPIPADVMPRKIEAPVE